MGRPATKDLTERELEVMHVFWSSGELTAAESATDSQRRAWIGPTHDREPGAGAHDKGFLHQLNSERPFVYRAVRSYEDVSGRLLGDLVQRVFRGSRAQLLCRLVEQRKSDSGGARPSSNRY